ncbi:MAG: hypothetical protein KDK04_28960 [Candidatus Competibacteraceae bacterium]|nr:hypothetical protein [Candidatus Competibacteraceae bacterium]
MSQIAKLIMAGRTTLSGYAKPISIVVSLLVLPGLMGCAINNMGLLAANVIDGEGAKVVDIYTIGWHLRTWNHDAGVSIGATKRTYIFPLDLPYSPNAGWHYLWVKLPSGERPVALNTQLLGLEIWASTPEYSLTIGYRNKVILAQIDNTASITMTLGYNSINPEQTQLTYCHQGDEKCIQE